jgi:hypothetical protein
MDLIRLAGLTAVFLAILIFWMFIVEYDFPVFKYVGPNPPPELVENDTSIIGQRVSWFLWNCRVLDLIAQAFVLFASATCCMALLRVEERKR